MPITFDILCFTNEAAPDADGWAMIAPFGDFPGLATIPNGDGSYKRIRAIQRIDKESAAAMTQHFRSGSAVKRFLCGTPIYLGHPDALAVGDRYPDKTAKGVFAEVQVRDNGFFGKPVFTNEGMALLEKNPALSGRWTTELIGEEMIGGKMTKIFRPTVFQSAGLTDKPNLPVELLNEFEAEAGATKKSTMKKEKVIALLKKHGIEIANDAADEAIEAALESLDGKLAAFANDKTASDAKISSLATASTTKDTTIASLTTERDTLRLEFTNERKARIEQLLDRAVTEGRITAAQRPEWLGKLSNAPEFANVSTELGAKSKVIKLASATGNIGERKAEMANASERGDKVRDLVTEQMSKGLSYDAAFGKVSREHKDLFEAMHQPQRQSA